MPPYAHPGRADRRAWPGGRRFGEVILQLAPEQPHVKDREGFIADVDLKMGEMRDQMRRDEGRAGENIRSFMASIREHGVLLDPSIMVAAISMVVLEGWQWRLDPDVAIMGSIEKMLNRRSSLAGWVVSIFS